MNTCPRDQKPLLMEKKTYGGIEVTKYKCTVCGTKFFFEEDILAFLIAKAK